MNQTAARIIMTCALALAVIPTMDIQRAAAQDLHPARVVPIQVNGDPATHFSLVILGDGYTTLEMKRFRDHVEKHLNILWSFEPFKSYRNYINVYAVEIESPQSGITCDPAHRQQRNTALSLYFDGGCTNPNARGILANSQEAKRYAQLATPNYDQILVIANTDTYGGIGGSIATTSGGNGLGPYITPHEIGHSLGLLQDEYTYYQRGVKGAAYKGTEPTSVHHTLMTEDEMRTKQEKWWRWLGEPSDAGGAIGRFEGGQYSSAGIWRPSKHSMMISLGYYFDQVSREQLTKRISEQVKLISSSTPTRDTLKLNTVVWIQTAHPVHAAMRVHWALDGVALASEENKRSVDIQTLKPTPGYHQLSVTAIDSTPFVRDPEILKKSFSDTRSWTIDAGVIGVDGPRYHADFTGSTPTDRPVGGADVIYVETTHSQYENFVLTWQLDDKLIEKRPDDVDLDLTTLALTPGTHALKATLSGGILPGTAIRTWTIDNTLPTASYKLGGDTTAVTLPNGERHYFVRDSFTMKLNASDDMPGYLVNEFRLDGDGWQHYYGWPDAPPDEPFHFTARGTTIKELVYGSLSSGGLSPQPWDPRVPGWGTHTIEYRALDAAGNYGTARQFKVTVEPTPACTTRITKAHKGNIEVTSGTMCIENETVTGKINVTNGASLILAHARVDGSINADGASTVEIISSTVSTANVQRTTQALTVFGSTFVKGLILDNNTPLQKATVVGNKGSIEEGFK